MYQKDPYEVLGVAPTAGDDEIKKAYREMIRKYHPDNYAGADQTLVGLAEEKFRDVQAAYNEIMERRALGDYSGGARGRQNSSYGGASYGNPQNNNGGWQQPYQQNYQNYGNQYGRPTNYNGSSGCGTGNLCCDLWCADTLCECMGGDLCSCM